MCGIYGMVALGDAPLRYPDRLDAMGRALRHRGPDVHGAIVSSHAALGVERLRVIDPTEAADQPFLDPARHVWLALNGTVYNARELRRRYDGYPFRSRSDAEPVLPLFLARGATGMCDIDGMFAIAIYQKRQKRLVLSRDRAGEKPLFYSVLGPEVWFASEVQALLDMPGLSRIIDRHALAAYVRWGRIDEPRTMFDAIKRVPAGGVATFDGAGCTVSQYWDPSQVSERPRGHGSASQLEKLLLESVASQLVADAPVGVFSSGGLDSSLLAALAAHIHGPRKLQTFAVGFCNNSYDERPSAKRFAAQLGATHFTAVADERSLHTILKTATDRIAEPIADPALLPTYLLAKTAREHVTVVLTGEGADELFGGYPTYVGHSLAHQFAGLPATVQRWIAGLVKTLPSSHRKVPVEFLLKQFVDGVALDPASRHRRWFGSGLPENVLPQEYHPGWPQPATWWVEPVREAMLRDFRSYLRDNLLPKVDRATMLASLEARAPYLAQDVVEFGLALPTSQKIRGLRSKTLLREVAAKWLPPWIVRRLKRGLSVPVAGWLNTGLRADVDRALDSDRLRAQGLVDPIVAASLVSQHRSGRANHARGLWTLLVLQQWIDRWQPDLDNPAETLLLASTPSPLESLLTR